MQLLRICLLLFAVHCMEAQPALTRASFSTSGLSNAKVLTNLYLGDFVNVTLERNGIMFKALFSQYLDAFARHCNAFLPANKVEIMRTVCAQEQTPVNRYGAAVGPTTCTQYRTEGTGLYADPVLYRADVQLESATALDSIGQVMRTMQQGNPLGSAMNTVGSVQVMANDMNSLVRINACNSTGLKRFQENVVQFALGKSPVRLEPASRQAQAGPFKDSDYTKLVEDLVFEQSRSWMMNRFVGGSVSNVIVSSRDSAGRPAVLAAQYLFNGRSRGSVKVTFTDGLPACMYFFDLPSMCRAPSSRIIAAYENGNYR